MKKTLFILNVVLASSFAMAQAQTTTKPATATKPVKVGNAKLTMSVTPPLTIKNSKDSASYALGYRIAQSLNGQGLQKINLAVFNKGLLAGFEGKSIIIDSILDCLLYTSDAAEE